MVPIIYSSGLYTVKDGGVFSNYSRTLTVAKSPVLLNLERNFIWNNIIIINYVTTESLISTVCLHTLF